MHDAIFKCDLSAPYKLKSDVFSLILPFFALDGKATNEAIIYYKELYLEINPMQRAIGRGTKGKDYKDVKKSLQRLNNTRITTNLIV